MIYPLKQAAYQARGAIKRTAEIVTLEELYAMMIVVAERETGLHWSKESVAANASENV